MSAFGNDPCSPGTQIHRWRPFICERIIFDIPAAFLIANPIPSAIALGEESFDAFQGFFFGRGHIIVQTYIRVSNIGPVRSGIFAGIIALIAYCIALTAIMIRISATI